MKLLGRVLVVLCGLGLAWVAGEAVALGLTQHRMEPVYLGGFLLLMAAGILSIGWREGAAA